MNSQGRLCHPGVWGTALDSVLDQCHYRCQELAITALQIYGPGQSKLLSLPLALAAEGFNLFPIFSLLLGVWL